MKLHVKKFTFNPIQENTYVVYTEVGDAVIIDPGCYERHEEQALTDFISENELNVLALLNTHGHIDHVLGNAFVKRKYNVDFYIHESDVVTVNSVVSYAHVYGFEAYNPSPEPDVLLKGGEKLTFGAITFDVLFTPGHAPGHVVFYNEESKLVINGDVLFQGSFGRVDLPGGDLETLKKSIFDIMFNLPEDTIIYCGHGPETTVGREKISNYILQY